MDLTQGFERPVTGWRWTSGPLVVRDVIVVAGVPAPATDILSEAQLAPKEMPPDDVRGYDVRTGKHLWTFHVVPRAGEPGNETWLENSWTYSGNSGVWTLLGADEELGHVYLPTEEATGDYYGGTRPGDNLYAESIVALDAATGKRVWHFQTLHHGIWDYDLPAPPVLADITVDGRRIKALAQVSKQAFVFVLNRETGEPVWPIEERPAPQGNVPGERYSPTQPFPTQAAGVRPTGRHRGRCHRLHARAQGRGDGDPRRLRVRAALHPARATRQPRDPEGHPARARHERWRRLGRRGARSGNQHSLCALRAHADRDRARALRDPRVDVAVRQAPSAVAVRPAGPPGSLQASVLASRRHRSQRGHHPLVGRERRRSAPPPGVRGLDLPPLGTPGALAALVTKSFVFMGEGSDTGVGLPPGGGYGGKMFRAFDKATGEIVWEMELPAGVSNAPMTYSAGGKQYIVVGVSGSEYPGELIALALP